MGFYYASEKRRFENELLTLLAFDGYSQTEIAAILGCVQSVVSRKLQRIKKYLN